MVVWMTWYHYLVNTLRKSIDKCQIFAESEAEELTEENIESIEALFARFSRSIDMMISKILRGIDMLEVEDVGTKLDVVIRAEKRGLVENYEELIALKDLRNELAHEYVGSVLIEKLEEVLEGSGKILEISEKIFQYVEKKLLPKLSSSF